MAQAQKKPALDHFALAELSRLPSTYRTPAKVDDDTAATAFSGAIRHPDTWRPSPAKDLQDMLSQWAEEITNPEAAVLAAPKAAMPMQARLALIGVTSLLLWSMIALLVYQISPIW